MVGGEALPQRQVPAGGDYHQPLNMPPIEEKVATRAAILQHIY